MVDTGHKSAISTDNINTDQGSTFNMLYGERDMKGYPVTEYELEQLSYINTEAQVYFSVGSFFVSLAISSKSDSVFVEKLTPAGQILSSLGIWIFGVVSFGAFFLGWRAIRTRRSLIKEIKSQTRHRRSTSI